MDVERDITVLVKTFERPDCLRRLVASIRRNYARIAIVVVDDSREPLEPAAVASSLDLQRLVLRGLGERHHLCARAGGRTYSVSVTCGNAFVGEATFDVTDWRAGR